MFGPVLGPGFFRVKKKWWRCHPWKMHGTFSKHPKSWHGIKLHDAATFIPFYPYAAHVFWGWLISHAFDSPTSLWMGRIHLSRTMEAAVLRAECELFLQGADSPPKCWWTSDKSWIPLKEEEQAGGNEESSQNFRFSWCFSQQGRPVTCENETRNDLCWIDCAQLRWKSFGWQEETTKKRWMLRKRPSLIDPALVARPGVTRCPHDALGTPWLLQKGH